MNEMRQGELFERDRHSQTGVRDCAADSVSIASGERKPDNCNWLRLVTTHRRLFEASQTGWFHLPADTSLRLGHRDYVSEDLPTRNNVVPVRLTFDMDRFPVWVAPDRGNRTRFSNKGTNRYVVHLQAPIPLYAITRLEVTSAELRSHLLAMADQFDNVFLPVDEVDIADSLEEGSRSDLLKVREDDATFTELPSTLNAVQGAMAMAVWSVPRIMAWVELLRDGLNQNTAEISVKAERLGVPWFRFPWIRQDPALGAEDEEDEAAGQVRLWQAALSVLQSPSAESKSAFECAELIARGASIGGNDQNSEEWLAQTWRLLNADDQISFDRHGRGGAGLAIQLVLLRPEPAIFRTWAKDLPDLSPSVWWAAAILCGWRMGYRAIGRSFRGNRELNEAIATRALVQSMEVGAVDALPPSQCAPIDVNFSHDSFALTWRGTELLRKKWHARGKWYNAELLDLVSDRAAKDMARGLGWACLDRYLALPEGRYIRKGDGSLSIENEDLVIKGNMRIQLCGEAEIEEYINQDEFRRLLATGCGVVSDVPANVSYSLGIDPSIAPKPALVSLHHDKHGVPGLIYLPDFISEGEEKSLVDQLDLAEWSDPIKRRVQQYGWRYDYNKRMIDGSARIGDMPEWAEDLARRLLDRGLVSLLPDQVIVNEYRGKQGISKHIDKTDDFAEHIATISLLQTWEMIFRQGNIKHQIPLERRSVTIMSGDARYRWTHEIPVRKTEPSRESNGKNKRISRDRRISLTFRKVNFSK